jgi:hypothetical protein
MSFIILVRNPRDKRVGAIQDDEPGVIHEFPTEGEAERFARSSKLCQAWGYEVVEAH